MTISPRARLRFHGQVTSLLRSPRRTPAEEDTLSEEEEAGILREALLKAESMGYDVSGVRLAGWDAGHKYP